MVAAFADTAAVPVERFAASDTTEEETASSLIGGVVAAIAESASLCHAKHVRDDSFLHGSLILLIVTHDENDSCALYLVDCSAWTIFRELLGCSMPCLQEQPVVFVFEPAAPRHCPDQFCLR